MASVTLANRELRNKATGIDIYVPRHEGIPGPLGGTVMYHVIVVTRLFYFKTHGKHKESDVVQFMIPHKFSVFEDLYHKLSHKFPSVIFTPLPKKALIVNDSVISERRCVMEDVVEQIARTPKLACSSLVLEFLGALQVSKDFNEDSTDDSQEKKTKQETEETAEDVDLFAEEEKKEEALEKEKEEEEVDSNEDLLTLAKTAAFRGVPQSSIFTVDGKDDDEDLGNLFVPAGAMEGKHDTVETEDNSELLTIDDDLEKLLTITKPKKPPKPALSQKPVPKPRTRPKPQLKPKPAPKPRFEDTTGNDDLFKSGESTKELGMKKGRIDKKDQGEELFAPRKSSLRKPSHEEESLDDIFKSSSKKTFPDDDDDDDQLFKSSSNGKVTDMSADDISSYIQHNAPQDNASLDLF